MCEETGKMGYFLYLLTCFVIPGPTTRGGCPLSLAENGLLPAWELSLCTRNFRASRLINKNDKAQKPKGTSRLQLN
jgi:hypothetical protein